jgi:hypothetical protein
LPACVKLCVWRRSAPNSRNRSAKPINWKREQTPAPSKRPKSILTLRTLSRLLRSAPKVQFVRVSSPRNWPFDRLSRREPRSGEPNCHTLIRLPAILFSGTLSRQSLLQSPLLARLQVVRVTLHCPNNVLGLNFALEPTEGILQRLALLQSNFRQIITPQTGPDGTKYSLHHLC